MNDTESRSGVKSGVHSDIKPDNAGVSRDAIAGAADAGGNALSLVCSGSSKYFVSQMVPFLQLDKTALNWNACLIVWEDCRRFICSKNLTISSFFIPLGSLRLTPHGRYSLLTKFEGFLAMHVNGA